MKITSKQFIKIALALGGAGLACNVIRVECHPDFAEVAQLAEDMALELDPDCDATLGMHFALMAVAKWAREQI